MDQFLGEIRPVPFNFAPMGWALCDGQILSIAQNTALFSLIGTNFGGDGKTNFALPNMQGSVPLGVGQSPGLSPYIVGQTGGSTGVTLTTSEMPGHSHLVTAGIGAADEYSPANNIPGQAAREVYSDLASANGAALAVPAVQLAGGGLPHNNMQPYLSINFVIALVGIFPSRP